MSWKPELDEIARRRALAEQMGGEERVARHVAAGRLPVRERIARLIDEGPSARRARSPARSSTTKTEASRASLPRISSRAEDPSTGARW